MKITDEYILSLDIFDVKGRLNIVKFNKLLEDRPDIKEYLENRYTDKFIDHKTALWRIRKHINKWPVCPTCGKLLDNLWHTHCSERCATLDPKVKNQREESTLKNHGVTSIFNKPEVRNKSIENSKRTIIEKYGSFSEFSKKYQVKANKTRKKHQEEDPEYWEKIKLKEQLTRKDKFKQDPDYYKKIKDKENETKRKNGTFNTSVIETIVYEGLCKHFSRDDVEREYSSKEYPTRCDFYIKSRNMYVECNFHWTHGDHWFNKGYKKDVTYLENLKSSGNKFNITAANVWSMKDVEKRNNAKIHNLNYIVLWAIEDYYIWEHLNFPDGQDWRKEYSWLPEKDMNIDKELEWPEFKVQNTKRIATKANWKGLYSKELEYWNNIYNHIILYRNRMKYLNKFPDQLTRLEIVRGIRISGKVKGFSKYCVAILDELLTKYDIHSVYDFCMGWGERLVCCSCKGVNYSGVEINPSTYKGLQDISEHYKLKPSLILGDSSKIKNITGSELVFTCPPYWNKEIYSDKGAENLEYNEFLEWWRKSITNAVNKYTKYFGFQIDRKMKDVLHKICLEQGFELLEEIEVDQKENHFTKGKKYERETVLFYRISSIT